MHNYFEEQMKHLVEKISSKKMKRKGILYQLYELFMPKITHIAVEVALNILKNMMF